MIFEDNEIKREIILKEIPQGVSRMICGWSFPPPPYFWKPLTSAYHLPSHLGPTIIKVRTTRGYTPPTTRYLVSRYPHRQWSLPSLQEANKATTCSISETSNSGHFILSPGPQQSWIFRYICPLASTEPFVLWSSVFFLSPSFRFQFYLTLTLTDSRNFMFPP